MKTIRVGIAAVLCFAMLMTGFAVQTVKAADVENQWLISIPGAPGGATFTDVAWSENGKLAVYAGYEGGKGTTYLYYPENGSWFQSDNSLVMGTTTQFRTIEFLNNSFNGPMFMIFGTSGSGGDYYSLQPQINNTIYHSTTPMLLTTEIYGSCVDYIWHRVILAGSKTATGAVSYAYNYSSAQWGNIQQNTNATNHMIYYGAAVIPNVDVPDIALVGANTLNSSNLYVITNSTTGLAADKSIGGLQAALTDITYDSNNNRAIISTALRADGGMGPGLYAIDQSSGFQTLHAVASSVPKADDLWGIDMSKGRAIAVGRNSTTGYGVVYDFVAVGGNTYMYLQSNSTAIFAARNFTGVAIRPAGIPMAMISGSAFKYSYLDSDSTIVVNTVYPHIHYVDLFNNGTAVSIMNSVTNVDPGDNSITYNLTVNGSYTAPGGASLISMVDVWMWFDGGLAGIDRSGLVDTGTPNLGAHFVWYNTSGGTSTIIFPTTSEWDYVGHAQNIEAAGGQGFTVSFYFRPNQQVRNATSGGTWSAGTGVTPGRFNGPAVDQQSNLSALDDPDSWDIKVRATDNTSLAFGDAYDEFGLNRYVYLGAGVALPGNGFLSGSGAPGQTVILQPAANQNVTFSANCYYDLRIWSTDLTGPSGSILANRLDVMGGALAGYVALLGPGEPNARYLIGGVGNGVYGRSGWYGVTNTTWNSPDGGNGFAMDCRIPGGTPEDTYTGILTYSITLDV